MCSDYLPTGAAPDTTSLGQRGRLKPGRTRYAIATGRAPR